MIEELIRQQGQLQRQLDTFIKPEVGYDFVSPFLGLPGLVGFWPMSSVQRSTGNVYDLSGQARTLTYNGNPTFNIYNNIVPYIDLDGTGDYLSRADETDLDILGTESWAAVPGLTMGGWFYPTTTNFEHVIGKFTGSGNNKSYRIVNNSGTWTVQISTDGSTTFSKDGVVTSANTWEFVVLRFVPSTSLDIFNNITQNSNTVAVPASIFNSAAAFIIGSEPIVLTNDFTGRASLCFLCANALPDALISSLFQATRGLFGV